ncbi:disintegrin and metalloproteinase domain-containing protein 18-like isoform X2 [Hemicordylus capensis]|uniref:disintegrin and metalloproteinase domain-containing protein 18-like isoform X2 n=1 Tax=Hemicordylus capensis TaxID=884348 RepID=UPI0023031CB1|nr:disintegrin and metalloproteinase domain-containing protein 18-like isoform X2 [Hemicordylus capensis]
MAWYHLAVILLTTCLVSALGFQRSFMEIVVPQRVPSDAVGNMDKMIFIIKLEGMLYRINLRRQSFLTNNFRIYTYSPGGSLMSVAPSIKRNCYYEGYVRDYEDSAVMLSTCAGLKGVLQFHNASYGIEPMGPTSGFQHLVYQIDYSNSSYQVSSENYSVKWSAALPQKPRTGVTINFRTMRYVEMYVIVAQDLYNFLGSNEDIVTEKITRLIGFVNAMFSKLNIKILLSSLEFWIDQDQIPTAGKVNNLLEKFADWKHSHLALRPHDVAFLFLYRDWPSSVGSTFARKICSRPSSAGIAVYQHGVTLESFSVIVAQLLGISLGIYFDNSRDCQCLNFTCLMHTKAIRSSGPKSFSSCSIKDFHNFLGYGEGQCLLNKPRMDIMYRAAFCGNKVVEEGEQCDCGTEQQCKNDRCCDSNCKLKSGKECAHGPCCEKNCKLKKRGTLCRNTPDADCDLKEYCNGTSTECSENFYVQNGQLCEGNTGVCMNGVCQSPDRWCRKIFGKHSKSGPPQCYEEINGQKDRMGHCGSSTQGYEICQWQDLRCGKLVCEYPSKKPFIIDNAAIIYTKVQNRLCVTLDSMKGPGVKDPYLVHDGTGCGPNKICLNQKCVDRAAIPINCDAQKKCHSKGVCNNKGNCHCNPGWAPPDCTREDRGGLGGSIDSYFRSGMIVGESHAVSPKMRNWLLVGFCVFLPVVIGAVILMVKWKAYLPWNVKEGEEGEGEGGEEEEEENEEEEEESESERSQEASQETVSV